uniref:NADH-ubiquinone oxidoreductase chain 3 n=2 Tax=Nasonia vitripennis TaxID=7425 RepID=B5T2Y6_NASVI|nr:NADH dehydrogenase subunit 3 [Nasonia vitripennis]ACH81731.1 NADH dehydrogenase subunit 3 [Nasonia vitripennis]UAY85750.1 NADH dehydrogenase subunit 3 [Nasonia vitripennis]UVN15287.1 NADH dehydrogenase subunit 3 [Nasonia vitripennis]
MLNLLVITLIISIILILMLLTNFIISKKMNKSREKMSPFECGYDPMSKNRLPFSLSFYLISIIFLIFDVEISLILPMIFLSKYYYYLNYLNMLIIMIILLMGLYMEWKEGALKWFK